MQAAVIVFKAKLLRNLEQIIVEVVAANETHGLRQIVAVEVVQVKGTLRRAFKFISFILHSSK